MRRDANYLYTAIRTTGGGDAAGLLFSNLYFSLRYGVTVAFPIRVTPSERLGAPSVGAISFRMST